MLTVTAAAVLINEDIIWVSHQSCALAHDFFQQKSILISNTNITNIDADFSI